MDVTKAISYVTTAVSLVASIVIGRDWLVSGGGDPPSLIIWSVLCVSLGFSMASSLFDRWFDRKLDDRTANPEELLDFIYGDDDRWGMTGKYGTWFQPTGEME